MFLISERILRYGATIRHERKKTFMEQWTVQSIRDINELVHFVDMPLFDVDLRVDVDAG